MAFAPSGSYVQSIKLGISLEAAFKEATRCFRFSYFNGSHVPDLAFRGPQSGTLSLWIPDDQDHGPVF